MDDVRQPALFLLASLCRSGPEGSGFLSANGRLERHGSALSCCLQSCGPLKAAFACDPKARGVKDEQQLLRIACSTPHSRPAAALAPYCRPARIHGSGDRRSGDRGAPSPSLKAVKGRDWTSSCLSPRKRRAISQGRR